MLLLVSSRGAKAIKGGLVTSVISVRKVKSSHGEAGIHKFFQFVHVPASRSQRTDDFRLAHGFFPVGHDHLQTDVGAAKLGPYH